MSPLASKSLWRPTVTQDYPLSNSSHKHMLMKTFHIHFIAKLNSQIGKRHRPFHSLPHARVPSQRSAQKSQHFILSHMLKKKKKNPKAVHPRICKQTEYLCHHEQQPNHAQGYWHLNNVYSNNPLHILSTVWSCDTVRTMHFEPTQWLPLHPPKWLMAMFALTEHYIYHSSTTTEEVHKIWEVVTERKEPLKWKHWLTPRNSYHSPIFSNC